MLIFRITSLMVYFFGINCDQYLKFEQFSNFVSNLQDEVLKFEFKQYSGGEDFLNGSDFANMILKVAFSQKGMFQFDFNWQF